jgi:hypothetical protein
MSTSENPSSGSGQDPAGAGYHGWLLPKRARAGDVRYPREQPGTAVSMPNAHDTPCVNLIQQSGRLPVW